jgi:hypothetical protein
MDIKKIIEIGEADLELLLMAYNYHSGTVRDAQKYNNKTKNQILIHSSLMDQAWAAHQALAKFILKIKEEAGN